MTRAESRPTLTRRAIWGLCLIACLAVAPATSVGDLGADTPPAAANRALRKVLLITNAGDEYHDDQARIMNLLDGMGLDFEWKKFPEAAGADLARYQLIIVAPVADRETKVPLPLEQRIITALVRGTNVLWVGGGIWGTFTSTNLPDAFGLRYVREGWNTDAGAASAAFTNLAGEPDQCGLYKENIFTVEAVKADTEAWFHDAAGKPLKLPFITHYRAGHRSGHAVFLAMELLTYWKAEEASHTHARAEVLFRYVRRLTSEGSVAKHPARDGHDAVFLLRLEDYVAGGTQMGHTNRLWPARMERLLALCRRNGVPLNIALVPIYRDPFRGEYHTWDDPDPVIVTLRRQARRAFDDGGSVVVHGYAHQYGNGPTNFSGSDWEVWDNAGRRFLPLAEQKGITANAFAEVVKQFGIRPTVWETPHYAGNADTTRAAYDAGFRYFTESDTQLFPNRHGYFDRMQGLILNIPETAGSYPLDPDEIKRFGLLKQKLLMPRLVRMNGLVYLFYHNSSAHQERALENLLAEAGKFDLWKPGVEEYARFWEKRERVTLTSETNPTRQQLVTDVAEAFPGLTLAARLPDGTTPAAVTVDGQPVKARCLRVDQAWYVYPVLPDAGHCRVVIGFQTAASPAAK